MRVKLTYQFIFLPLLFVASLFGMNVNLLENNPSWIYYLIISIPLFAILMLLVFALKWLGTPANLDQLHKLSARLRSAFSRSPKSNFTPRSLDDPEPAVESDHLALLKSAARNGWTAVLTSGLAALKEWEWYHLLSYVAQAGDPAVVDALLQTRRVDSGKLLLTAAGHGNRDVVQLLVERGVKGADQTPLHPGHRSINPVLYAAAQGGHLDVMKLLLKRETEEEQRALLAGLMEVAVEEGYADMLTYILNYGSSTPGPLASEQAITALQLAVKGRHHTIISQLLMRGADVNAPTTSCGDPRSPLTIAAANGDESMIDLLLRHGAEVDTLPARNEGRTPLQAAAERGHQGIVELLLDRGADINAPCAECSGLTAVQAAAKSGARGVVQILLDKGADIHAPPAAKYGSTTLQAASGAGHTQIVKLLLQYDVDVNEPPAAVQGRTALQAAAYHGHASIVQLLIYRGAEVDAPAVEEEGRTALQAAAEMGHRGVVRLLLDRGAEVDAPGARVGGMTALVAAVSGGHGDVVELLLRRGARVDRAAVEAAERRGDVAIKAMLVDARQVVDGVSPRVSVDDGSLQTSLDEQPEKGNANRNSWVPVVDPPLRMPSVVVEVEAEGQTFAELG